MWRKLQREDIKLGLVVRYSNGRNAFDDCVITAMDHAHGEPTIWLARPYVYAREGLSTKSPLLGCEVFGVSEERACEETSDFKVLSEERHNGLGRLDCRAVCTHSSENES